MVFKKCVIDTSQLQTTMNAAISAIAPHVNNDIHRATTLLFVPLPRAYGMTAFQMFRKGFAAKAVEIIKETLIANQRKNAVMLKNMDVQRQKLQQL